MLVLRRVLFKHHLLKTGLVLQPEKQQQVIFIARPSSLDMILLAEPLKNLPLHENSPMSPDNSNPNFKQGCLHLKHPETIYGTYIITMKRTYEKGTFEIPIGNHFRGSGFLFLSVFLFFRIYLPTLTTNIIKNYIYVLKGIYLHGLHLALLFLKWDYFPWN